MDAVLQKACENLQNMDIQFKLDNLSVKVDFVRIEAFKPGMGFDAHAHSNLEFHYIKSGHGTVEMEGIEYPLGPGSMYVTGSGLVHSQKAPLENPMLEYALKCSLYIDKVPSQEKTPGEEEYIYSIFASNPAYVAVDSYGIDHLFEKVFQEAFELRPGYFGQIKALIFQIILLMARGLAAPSHAEYNVPHRNIGNFRIDALRRYITDNISRNITCEEVSRYLYLSKRQLSRVMLQKTGMSTHDFILHEKLKAVKHYLLHSGDTLAAVAAKTGFSSEFHLSNTFRKKLGISPEQFRKQNSNHAGNPFYPLTFKPLFKDYIWGGRNLEKLGKALPKKLVAESWEVSTHHDGMNIVASGIFAGQVLEDLGLEYGRDFLGSLSYARYKKRFPFLLKFIDANDWLSVQVHPGDEYARMHENDLGKTEMWYILDALPGSTILYGLNRKVSRDELKIIIQEGRIGDVLRSVPVKTGDVVYIPAGTIHAAGRGILMAEVQQSSNATYRLHDFNRKNSDGSSRPLHIEQALDSIDYDKVTELGFCPGLPYHKEGMTVTVLIADPHFCTDVIDVDGEASLIANGRSLIAYTFLSGNAVLSWHSGTMEVKAGQSVLIPASMGSYSFKGKIKALRAYIGNIEEDILKPLKEQGYTEEQMKKAIGGLSNFISAGADSPS